ncbi:MAG: hypothetical protein L0271_07220 [Gemmatimonadetes bacterium]|nr:hypothetical protein [Gemmatimonadota bacterium]
MPKRAASPLTSLRALERARQAYGGAAEPRKLALLRGLERRRLRSATAVHRLHEVLCFLRAYPDSAAVLAQVDRMVDSFARRSDVRAHAEALADTGIAGTPIAFPFFTPTAQWLAQRWPDRLSVDWTGVERPDLLERALHLLVLDAEVPAIDEWSFPLQEWIDRLKAPDETDATFLIRRLGALRASPEVRQLVFEEIGLSIRLEPGPGTPSRTHARVPVGRVHWQRGPLSGARSDLCRELRRAPRSVRSVSRRDGERLIDLAREAMVTRSRDLDVFMYGDPADVRLVDHGDGLGFVVIGAIPERRLLLEAVYGFLTLKNGVPVGYVLNSALYGSAEIAYNVFDTYRGAEAAAIYARVLAAVHHLFGADTFTIYPYQLGGHGNEEGLESGAWWFYQKLGFRARDPGVLARMDTELARMRRNRKHRSSLATLRVLGEENVYLHCARRRDDVIGILPLANVGLAVAKRIAARFGADRERALETCSREAATRLGIRSFRGRSPGERLAWTRWAPLVTVLPGVEHWSQDDRRALVEVIRAKGGRRESDFVQRFDAHTALRRALRRLAIAHEPD